MIRQSLLGRPGAGRIIRAIALLLSCLAASPALSADTDDLVVIDSTEPPWPAIGRVNRAGYRSKSMCSGTLITPRIVLTAAHCVYNRKTGKPFPAEEVLFIAGVRRDEYAARLEADCILVGDGYVPSGRPAMATLHHDVALMVLKTDSPVAPVPPLGYHDAAFLNRETLFQSVGYRKSRSFLPTLVPACKVIALPGKVWITDCSAEQGVSGGPFLAHTPNGLRVAGVTTARLDGGRSAVVPFTGWQNLLASPTCGDASESG